LGLSPPVSRTPQKINLVGAAFFFNFGMMLNADETADKSPTNSQASGPLITVAICTRNRAALLEKAVRSVLRQMTGDAELLIVDNASTDDTPAVAARLVSSNPRVTVYREAEPGISAARNAALKQARGEFVLFLDDDETAETDWLVAYQRFLSAPPSEKIAAVGGAYFTEFEIPPARRGDASISFDCGDSPKCLPYPGSLYGGNTAYRRETALAVGMFDPQLGRREDSDMNLRLQDAGYEIWWLPGAAIWHFSPAKGMKFHIIMRERFNDGRFIAIQRLKSRRKGWDRGCYRIARIIGGPFHALAHLLAALIALPRRYSKAAEHVLQACRNCGVAWGMLVNWKPPTSNDNNQTVIGKET
jgi:glycosyltransferase involved in cell wall biosynthesis